jgi:DNA-binding response OmpR family regulator
MNKLLILDNSPDLLDTLKYILGNIGYKVKTLVSADNIYSEIHDFQPDLLLLDIFLGEEDGREICRQLRKSGENKDLRILVFSSYTKALHDYKSFYADDYIEKPFELKSLVDKINLVLN